MIRNDAFVPPFSDFHVIFSQQSTGGDDRYGGRLACLDCSKGSVQRKLYDFPLRSAAAFAFFSPFVPATRGPTFFSSSVQTSAPPSFPLSLLGSPLCLPKNKRQQNQEAICKLGQLAGDGTTSRENKHATSRLTYFSKRQRNSSPGMDAVFVHSSPNASLHSPKRQNTVETSIFYHTRPVEQPQVLR